MPRSRIHRYLRHGTLPQLRLFEASARLGCLARAAEELHMAQPTASVQLRKLTETVGVPLFEHVGNRLHLTDAGRRLQQGYGEIFGALEAVEDSLAGLRALGSGRLRLAVSSTGMSFAPRLVAAFLERHPGVEVALAGCNRSELLARLRSNADDLYLFTDAPELDDVVAQALLPNPLVVVARDDHELQGQARVPLARLAQEPLLVREEGSGLRRAALRAFRQAGLAPNIRLELDTNEAIKEAILAGLGVAVAQRSSFGLDPESPRLRCLDVEGFPTDNHWYLAYPVGKQLGATLHSFRDFARTEARRLAAEAPATP